MFNLLIADDNFNYARNLMSFINEFSKQIRVSKIAIDGKETLEALNNDIDIVLLYLKMPIYNGIDVINKLSISQQSKYERSFIIITGENDLMNKLNLNYNKVIYRLLPKTLTMQQIMNCISDLIKEKEMDRESYNTKIKIIQELLTLGYDISSKGTKYLVDIIELAFIRGEEFTDNLNKYVYPIIAARYNQSINNIKSNVIRATEKMYYNCLEEKLVRYFSFSVAMKPNIKAVINTVLLKLYNEK